MKFRAFFGEKETLNFGFNCKTVFKFKDPFKVLTKFAILRTMRHKYSGLSKMGHMMLKTSTSPCERCGKKGPRC